MGLKIRELSFLPGEGAACLWEDQNFSGWPKGDAVFFHWAKVGDLNFLSVKEGGGHQNFSLEIHKVKGGTRIFPRRQRLGDQNIFTYGKGGTRKN